MLFAGASSGFASATRDVGFVAAGLIGLGFLASLFLPRNAARTEAAGYVTAAEERTPLPQAEARPRRAAGSSAASVRQRDPDPDPG